MTAAEEAAPAKVNLALHVTGRRGDGYHLLDTLAVFPPVGDSVRAEPAGRLSLTVIGPEGAVLRAEDAEGNLVARAARGIAALAGLEAAVALTLDKRLPVAAGLGGGSADAAATLRLLCRLWGIDPADGSVAALALSLGADVPMCLASRPVRARGIGEALEPMAVPAGLGILLANPRVAVSTAEVFRRLPGRDNPPVAALPPSDPDGFLAALAGCRNDLEAAARAIAPEIGDALETIGALRGCRLARMSGSGATVFGIFGDLSAAQAAAAALAVARPGWWIAAAPLSSPG